MTNPWIKIQNISRHYKRGDTVVRALDDVSLEIDRGEFVAIVGASGSGKSTLLNLIAGLDTPTDGIIELANRDFAKLSAREKARIRAEKISMVFQSFNLLPQHTALVNIEMGLFFDKVPKSIRRDKGMRMIEKLGLSERANHRPADLSGGEQQRVAFARALVKAPELLLADEPTGNLDKDNAETIINLMRDLNSDGQTIIMVTHDIQMAQNSADRIIKLRYGRVDNGKDSLEH